MKHKTDIKEALKIFKMARICNKWDKPAGHYIENKNGSMSFINNHNYCGSNHPRCRYCRGEVENIRAGEKGFDGTCKTCFFCMLDEEKQRCPYYKNS